MREIPTIALYLEPIRACLDDPGITEIVINEPGELLIEKRGEWSSVQAPATNHGWCDGMASLLRNLSSQNLTEDWPLLGASLPGGERVQVVIPPALEAGKVSFTIRRPSTEVLSLKQIIEGSAFDHTRLEQSALLYGEERARLEDALTENQRDLLTAARSGDWHAFLDRAVFSRENVVVSGATGSGKTTLGNALAAAIPLDERIITVEDTREMRLPHRNQVNLLYAKDGNGLSKVTPRHLLEAALRMRPDRVLLAELRGSETFYFIQNVLNSGNPGTITTVHATRAKLAFQRLALLIKGSPEGAGMDLADILTSLYTLVDVVVQMVRMPDGDRIATEVYYDPAFALRQLG